MLDVDLRIIVVCQGELAVSGDQNVALSAVLGSCIATCLWDPERRVGGMNHILLPGCGNGGKRENKYGIFAMEALINELMRNGAVKSNLRAKVFGGARTFQNGLRIGEANAEFVRNFLKVECIPIEAESVGGTQARRVRFFPESGNAKQMMTIDEMESPQSTPVRARIGSKKIVVPTQGSGEVELF